MAFRFLHASDLHLGKPFGSYPEGIRNRLREARHGVIARLACAAREGNAAVVLLAGDTFDAETPAPDTLRHALRAFQAEADITWIMLPGNHDSLAASELWSRIAADGPANLVAVTTPEPLEFGGAWILPAPCTQRRPGRDLTEAMDAATPEGALRIGLGHGAITDFSGKDFSGEEGRAGIIPPDRANLSGLAYLALGDWHGRMSVSPRTWYSGTPEADSFKHDHAAGALLVSLQGAGAPPQVSVVETGVFRWQHRMLDLVPGIVADEVLAQILPDVSLRRDTLLRVTGQGRLDLGTRAALSQGLDAAAPDFGWFEADLSALGVETLPEDLDMIDRQGALRQAAAVLLAESQDPALAERDLLVAASALARLYALAQEVGA